MQDFMLAHNLIHTKCAKLCAGRARPPRRVDKYACGRHLPPARQRATLRHSRADMPSLFGARYNTGCPGDSPPSLYQEFLLLAIFQAAGWPIWLLLIASIVALALIIERLLYLRRAKILPRKLFDEVVQVYRSGKITPDTVAKLEDNSPLGVVLAAALRNVDAPREVMKESIEEAGSGVAHVLERYLTTLGTIATLAPLMGLFGTVVGMIEIFGSQNASGSNPAQLAHGISVALYNTGFGLAIAMPTLVFYRHFRALVDSFVIDMEQQAVKFVDIVHSGRK